MKTNRLPCLFWLILLLATAASSTLPADIRSKEARPESKPAASKSAVKAWKKSMDLGRAAADAKRYPEARDYFTAAVAEAGDFGEQDSRLAESSAALGTTYYHLRNYSSAEPFLERAAQIYELGSNKLDYANTLRDLGLVQRHLRNFEAAEKNFRKAQSVFETALGPDSAAVGECVLNVAEIKNSQEKFSEAEQLYKQAVKIMQNQPRTVKMTQTDLSLVYRRIHTEAAGPNHSATLHALLRLAFFYNSQARYAEAGDILQTALELTETKEEQLKTFLPLVLGSFADLYAATTNYAKAEPVLLKLLGLEEKNRGQKHPEVLKILTTLAYTYEREGKSAEAEKTYLKVLKTKEAAQSSDNTDTIGSVMNLARFYFEQHRYKEAQPLYQRALGYEEKSHGETIGEDPLLEQLIAISTQLENKGELEAGYKKRIKLYQESFGSSHQALIKPLEDYAGLLRKEKRDAEAAPLEARAKTIREASAK
ncbi:MAG: Tfp pilus assembly protein PilF [Pedosphaera sp.]|nr:Tfp pilus assembly protein PilF [Pedosphaera sp.]